MSRSLAAKFQREQLHRAAEIGDLAKVQLLLAAKYPVNRFDELGRTPLHDAVAGEHMAVVDALLRAGANVNARDERRAGDTPLGQSADSCSCAMAKKLMDAGADPAIPGWMQLTPIDRAKRREDEEGRKVLQLLRSRRPNNA